MLLFLVENPDRDFSPAEIVVSMRPVVVTASAVAEFTEYFAARGLLTAQDSRYGYNPSPKFDRDVAALAHAYNHRPLTLIGAIYKIAGSKIQSSADVLNFRRDEP